MRSETTLELDSNNEVEVDSEASDVFFSVACRRWWEQHMGTTRNKDSNNEC